MPLGCTIYTATSGNGAKTGSATIPPGASTTQKAPSSVCIVSCGVGLGVIMAGSAALLFAPPTWNLPLTTRVLGSGSFVSSLRAILTSEVPQTETSGHTECRACSEETAIMRFVIPDHEADFQAPLGGKARALASLRQAGLPIPAWFVVTPDAFHKSLSPEQGDALRAAHDVETIRAVVERVRPVAE